MKRILPVLLIFVAVVPYSCSNNTDQATTGTNASKTDTANTFTAKGIEDTANHKHEHLSTTAAGGSSTYTIVTPKGWTKTADTIVKGGGKYVQLTSPQEITKEDFRESINVITEKLLKPGLDNYTASSKTNMLNHIPGISILKEGDASINGIPAKWIKYGFMYGPVPHTNIVYLLIKGETGYAVTCNAETTKYEQYEAVFKQAVNTLIPGE